MKRLLSIILLLTLFLSSISVNVFATSYSQELKNTEDLTLSANEIVEKKIISDATLEDDFEDDSVIVVFKNSNSRSLNNVTVDTFPEISAKAVEDLTAGIDKKIEKQRQRSTDEDFQTSTKLISTPDELYVDESKYHQIVAIDLGVKSKENVLKCVKILEKRDDVFMVFPNYIYKSAKTPNDPKYNGNSQWAIDKIQLPQAWEKTTGSASVKVGIIDSGIYGEHDDLENRVNLSLGGVYTGIGTKLTDEGGHGTVVAGVIGAEGNNSLGITGVCWNVSLVSLKAAVDHGSYCTVNHAHFVSALTYATNNNIQIVNYSYGGFNNIDSVHTALGNYPGLLICAAGNNAKNITQTSEYPEEMIYDNMIIVAGTDKSDKLYSYTDADGKKHGSNYSKTKVHLAAPGYDICTTSSSGGYTNVNGTSLAAPYVTGVAALLKSKYQGMDAKAIKDYILSNVDVIEGLENFVETGGRLNAYKALTGLKHFSIVFMPNGGGGSAMQNQSIIYGCATAISNNTYTKAGNSFAGWTAYRPDDNTWYYTNGTHNEWCVEGEQDPGYRKYVYRNGQKVSRTGQKDGRVYLYAQWEPNEINIVFESNNATSGSMAMLNLVYNTAQSLPANTFERSGCFFDHWYAKNTDGKLYYTDGSNGGWYNMSEIPDNYTRKDFADRASVRYSTFEDVSDGDTVVLCAYWKPNLGILGDVDGNGSVSTSDVSIIQKYLNAQLTTLSTDQLLRADVNFDGNVSIKDTSLIQKYIAHIIDEFGE